MSKSSARRPKWSPAELARAAKERFLALDASTFAKWSFRCILESNNFELFFKYVELPTFDIASDALATFKFFELSEKLLASPKYVTRRQIL